MNESGNSNHVQMVGENEPTATRTYTQHIRRFARLGREVKISPKANASINDPGFKMDWAGSEIYQGVFGEL